MMQEIATTAALAEFCKAAATAPYVTVDTEFLRERTYYAQLCLVQVAYPGDDDQSAALIDVQADGLSLDPLWDLMKDESVIKVFHAARQDLEIFYHMGNLIPTPLFDTQVAAMVCGYGEQVGYETLVRSICKAGVDKSSRFTDWSQRPLSDKQKAYAIADVTFLREVYEKLLARLEKNNRLSWVQEEMAVLTSPATYVTQPEDAWKRVKTRNQSPKFLAIVRELAKTREALAQGRNVPRNRLYKDDALLELAVNKPQNPQQLGKSRLLLREARKGDLADAILKAIADALALAPEDFPEPRPQREGGQVNPALLDLARVLLKSRSESSGVAQKLIATAAELESFLATPEADHPLHHGWRSEIFGSDVQRLARGELALCVKGKSVDVTEIG